jgi:hypothetical protein
MSGGSACVASAWRSDSAMVCKSASGVGGGARRGQGLPVVVSVGAQGGSRTQAWSYDAAVVSSAGGATNGASSGCVSLTVAGAGLGASGYSGAGRVGRSGASDADMSGGSACVASAWRSDSAMVCKSASGVGGGARRGQGLPVVVSVGAQGGSRTQAWSYDAAVVSSAGGATNGVSSGCVSLTVAGAGLGASGYSGAGRVGRSGASDADMSGGSACVASAWRSDSAMVCKSASGVGGGARRGQGLPVVVSVGAQGGSRTQAWSYDAAVVSSAGGATNGGEQRLRVFDCCGSWTGSVWLLWSGSSRAVWSERRGHERRQCVRCVCVAV